MKGVCAGIAGPKAGALRPSASVDGLATIREYALERLADSGDEARIRERWAALYLELAQAASEQLGGEQQGRWLRQLDAEQHNLRAVLSWYTEHGNTGDALRMIAASWRFWHIRFRRAEGLRWVEQALAMPGHHDEGARAQVLCAAACWTKSTTLMSHGYGERPGTGL